MNAETPRCLICQRDQNQAPLLTFQFSGQSWWICAEHLPILIHQPARLAGLLPGAERFLQTQEPQD